jgi:hypothetical protein
MTSEELRAILRTRSESSLAPVVQQLAGALGDSLKREAILYKHLFEACGRLQSSGFLSYGPLLDWYENEKKLQKELLP